MASRSSFPGGSGRDMRSTSYLHLMLRLRMSKRIPPLPLHIFTACVETSVPFFLIFQLFISLFIY
jgi:hypothetical protein